MRVTWVPTPIDSARNKRDDGPPSGIEGRLNSAQHADMGSLWTASPSAFWGCMGYVQGLKAARWSNVGTSHNMIHCFLYVSAAAERCRGAALIPSSFALPEAPRLACILFVLHSTCRPSGVPWHLARKGEGPHSGQERACVCGSYGVTRRRGAWPRVAQAEPPPHRQHFALGPWHGDRASGSGEP